MDVEHHHGGRHAGAKGGTQNRFPRWVPGQSLGERLYSGKDRNAHDPYPNPYRTAIVACNDH